MDVIGEKLEELVGGGELVDNDGTGPSEDVVRDNMLRLKELDPTRGAEVFAGKLWDEVSTDEERALSRFVWVDTDCVEEFEGMASEEESWPKEKVTVRNAG